MELFDKILLMAFFDTKDDREREMINNLLQYREVRSVQGAGPGHMLGDDSEVIF